MITAEFKFTVGEDLANIAARALSVEGRRNVPRTGACITRQGDALILELSAHDINALRAGTNSYLRWVNEIIALVEFASTLKPKP